MPNGQPSVVVQGPVPGRQELVGLGVQLLEAIAERLRARAEEQEADPSVGPADSDRRERALRRLARRNVELAAALGACRCWGFRPDCPECGGDGRPGYFGIHRTAFAAFVAPAIAAQPEVFARHLPRPAAARRRSTDKE